MSVLAALLRYLWRQHRAVLATMTFGLLLFQFLITRIAPEPAEVSWMSGLLAVVPPQLLALAGSDAGALSPAGFLALGYGHPFFLLILSAWTVRVASAALAGEVGRGTIDLIAARPVTRIQQLGAASLAIAGGVVILLAAALLGTAIGAAVRPLGVNLRAFAAVALMAWLLFVSFGAIGLLVSAGRRDAGSAIAWTAGFIAFQFVLDYLARLWQPIRALRAVSLFAYYRPQAIVGGGLAPRDALTLALITVVVFAAAVALFRRRDL
jgi:ABC-2 type transport system permease protein